jgi:hypothetical protein
MNTEKTEANLLADARQDYVGLHEIVWDLNTQYPEVPEAEKIAAARSIVRRIMSSGEGTIFRSSEWPPHDYQRLEWKDAASVIDSDEAFKNNEGTGSTIYWIAVDPHSRQQRKVSSS